jgi:peptidoglycan hydrolase-like protein with peptidoglycan-binding domain
VLAYGSRGEQVKTLQRLLNALGYGSLKIDGDYGNATKASVGRMQEAMKQKNLIQNVDYIVGEKSWNYLLKG